MSEEERRYESGTKAQLLDVVSVPLKRHLPMVHQVENHELDDEHYWRKEGRASWKQVRACVDEYDGEFWRQAESTFHGQKDKIPEADLASIGSSLKLILVPKLRLRVRKEEGYEGAPARRRVRGSFEYHGAPYLSSVTDPEIEEQYLQKGDGDYDLAGTALCISLTEPWNGYAFRLIASVLTEERCSV